MVSRKKIVIRCDASIQIGSGHLMRCLTLANALRDKGGEVTFICRDHPGHLFDLIESSSHRLMRLPSLTSLSSGGDLPHAHLLGTTQEEDARQTIDSLKIIGYADWLIVDHYALDIEWESVMRRYVERIMVIDDLADRKHDCDVLLDQNYCAGMESRYDNLVPPNCKKMLGSDYVLLRPEFRDVHGKLKNRDGRINRIFIFFGGSDPTNDTEKTLRAIQKLNREGVAIDVVVGASNQHREEISRLCTLLPEITLHSRVGNMAELMGRADLAIGAGGGALWERCCAGLPAIVISSAKNQQAGCEAVAASGGILYLGDARDVDIALIEAALRVTFASPGVLLSMSKAGAALIDGCGAVKVSQQLVSQSLELRLADENDCEGFFRWRNHEKTRQYFFNAAPISWEDHQHWFFQKLKTSACILLVGQVDGEPVGVLRYDLDKHCAVVSVYMAPDKHGLGYGTALLMQGEDWIRLYYPEVTELIAEVFAANQASVRAFSKAGFKENMMTFKKIVAM